MLFSHALAIRTGALANNDSKAFACLRSRLDIFLQIKKALEIPVKLIHAIV